MLFFIMDI